MGTMCQIWPKALNVCCVPPLFNMAQSCSTPSQHRPERAQICSNQSGFGRKNTPSLAATMPKVVRTRQILVEQIPGTSQDELHRIGPTRKPAVRTGVSPPACRKSPLCAECAPRVCMCVVAPSIRPECALRALAQTAECATAQYWPQARCANNADTKVRPRWVRSKTECWAITEQFRRYRHLEFLLRPCLNTSGLACRWFQDLAEVGQNWLVLGQCWSNGDQIWQMLADVGRWPKFGQSCTEFYLPRQKLPKIGQHRGVN